MSLSPNLIQLYLAGSFLDLKKMVQFYFFYSNSRTLLHTLKTPIHINT